MELQEFTKKVLLDLDSALTAANMNSSRTIRFKGSNAGKASVEFDIAVTAEESSKVGGTGTIKVLGIAQAGLDGGTGVRTSIVSRVTFGVEISYLTKEEVKDENSQWGLS